ncbi:hypothetical protein DFH09DRAFT_989136 [Mycena vulgaris]|nr:hypothetical protein DFH09DRAFT_989136 [Mycena vulgaris]
MEVDIQPTALQRVQDLWFADGNLVIQAGNSQFRVYRGILAARSPVFQDMLSFPQPPDSELVEGLPLVNLPDAETEVIEFLKAIFIPEYFAAFPALTKFEIIVGCLRLSHKYEVDYLRRRALIHLSSVYRTTLVKWDSSGYTKEPTNRPPSEIDSWPLPNDPTCHIRVIPLAREVGALWTLPIAFYGLSGCFVHSIGTEAFDGTVYNKIWTALSIQDQQCWIAGRDMQTRTTFPDIMQFLWYPLDIEGCTSPTECLRERLGILEGNRGMIQSNSCIPLGAWDADDWGVLSDVCPACLVVLKRKHAEARRAFWDKLPSMYALPPWEELEKMKLAAIGDAFV